MKAHICTWWQNHFLRIYLHAKKKKWEVRDGEEQQAKWKYSFQNVNKDKMTLNCMKRYLFTSQIITSTTTESKKKTKQQQQQAPQNDNKLFVAGNDILIGTVFPFHFHHIQIMASVAESVVQLLTFIQWAVCLKNDHKKKGIYYLAA